MTSRSKGDLWLGIFTIVAALALLFLWIPFDVETGIVERVRRRLVVGDALGPTLAGVVILLGGALTWLRPDPKATKLTHRNLVWVLLLFGVLGLGLTLMRFAGPTIAGLVSEAPYRSLRTTPPWSYLGYLIGGTVMTGSLIFLCEKRFRLGAIVVSALAALAIALFYDLPFDTLLLPPNGDV